MKSNNVGTSEKEVGKVDSRVWYLLLLPLLVFVFFLLLYFYLMGDAEEEKEIPSVQEKIVQEGKEELLDSRKDKSETFVAPELEGEIYLTLSPFNYEDEGFVVQPNIYRFDIATQELAPYPFFDGSYNHNYMASFSPDLEKMTFIKSYEGENNRVMILNPSTEELRSLTRFLDFFPRNPRFSPDGEEVIYWGGGDLMSPEDSSIYIVSLEGDEPREITNGAYPVYSPDGESIIFLKNDGLYILNLETGEDYLAVDLTDKEVFPDLQLVGPGWYAFRFNLSSDGSLLVITHTLSENSNQIFEITSWDPFDYEDFAQPEFSQPIWPVFSPDNRYLALEEYRFDGERDSLRLSIYDTETFEIVGNTCLEHYELDYVWVSDWIVR